jgi:ankyrin repeat protein
VESGIDAVKLAVELGNDVNATNNKGETPLHAASFPPTGPSLRLVVKEPVTLAARSPRTLSLR